MNQWDYVIVVYAITIAGTAGLTGWCAWTLRRAERRLEDAKRT